MVDETLLPLENGSPELEKSGKSTSDKTIQRSELSLDINDILELDLDEPLLDPKNDGKEVKEEKRKCWPTVLGGADMSSGCSRITSPRICSALHCRDCDLSVTSFPHHEWMEHVEYLYLRTNMPNLEKVSEKLRKKEGAMAYACHCVSFSTDKFQPLHQINLPWFCRGHL